MTLPGGSYGAVEVEVKTRASEPPAAREWIPYSQIRRIFHLERSSHLVAGTYLEAIDGELYRVREQ